MPTGTMITQALIGQRNCFEDMRVVTPTASGASCVLGLQRAWAQPQTDSSTCSSTSSQLMARPVGGSRLPLPHGGLDI
jgi:hypothetical protein